MCFRRTLYILAFALVVLGGTSWAKEVADYYHILGVSRTVTDEELKSAWRKLLRVYHPDVAPSGRQKEYEERAKAINEAYQVLSDHEKRAVYDRHGRGANPGNTAGSASSVSSGGFEHPILRGLSPHERAGYNHLEMKRAMEVKFFQGSAADQNFKEQYAVIEALRTTNLTAMPWMSSDAFILVNFGKFQENTPIRYRVKFLDIFPSEFRITDQSANFSRSVLNSIRSKDDLMEALKSSSNKLLAEGFIDHGQSSLHDENDLVDLYSSLLGYSKEFRMVQVRLMGGRVLGEHFSIEDVIFKATQKLSAESPELVQRQGLRYFNHPHEKEVKVALEDLRGVGSLGAYDTLLKVGKPGFWPDYRSVLPERDRELSMDFLIDWAKVSNPDEISSIAAKRYGKKWKIFRAKQTILICFRKAFLQSVH
jgi:curved DNA-binding protein CbpA